MPRLLEIRRRIQDLVEEIISVKEEYRSPCVHGAEVCGEIGEAAVPGGDRIGEGGGFAVVGTAVERGYVEEEEISGARGVELGEIANEGLLLTYQRGVETERRE